MEIEAFLADSVENVAGKLYVLGAGWNKIATQVVPFQQTRIGLGILFRVPYAATSQSHRFEIALLDDEDQQVPLGDATLGTESADGKVRRVGAPFNVGRPPTVEPGDEQWVAVAINFDGIEFVRAGAYRFVVELDGAVAKELPFRIHHAVRPAPVAS